MIVRLKEIFIFLGIFLCFPVFAKELPKDLSENCRDGIEINAIRLEGLEYTNQGVIFRELLHNSGDKYSKLIFEIEKRKLQDLDLFTEIVTTCESTKNNENILVYHFKEIFRWIPAPAGKKTDKDGLMIGLALANLNVLGEDIRAEFQYRTAINPLFDNNEYAFYASSPYLCGIPLGFNFEFLRTNSYDEIRRFQDASYLADLNLNLDLYSNFSLLATLVYRYLENGPGYLPEFGFGFSFDYRDAILDTRKGVYFEYMMTHVGNGTNQNVLGENYWELLNDFRGYYPLGKFITGVNALMRYRLGYVMLYDYYYHGGANTFRGHEADSIYVGKHEILLNLEERFILMERHSVSLLGINFFYGVQLVLGLDGSTLWNSGSLTWDDYEGALYGGIHLVIPALDRIRFEVGYSRDKGEPVFYLGLFDKTTSARWRSR